MRSFILLPLILAGTLLLGFLSSQYSTSPMLVMGVGAVIIFVISFANIQFGLYILIFSMLLSPEFLMGQTGAGTLGRGVTLRLEDFLLVVIGISWLAKNAVFKEIGLFLKTPLNRPILFYVLASIVSTGLAILVGRVEAKTGFFYVLKYIEYYIVYFMMVNQAENQEQVKRFVFCLLLTCFIASIIGMSQIPQGGRVSAPFEGEEGEPNTFGGYLMFMAVITGGLLMNLKDKKAFRLLILLIIFIIPPFLFTQSRASYLGMLAAVFALALMSERRVIVTGLLFVSLIISPLFLPSAVRERILFTFTQPEEAGQIEVGDVRLDTSLSARLVGYQEAVRDWLKRPVLGYGVTGYKFVDAQFPRVLAETGIIGLMAFIFLLYTIFKITRDNLKELKTPYARGLTMGFLAGYIGLLFHALGANTFIIVRIMEPFWFFVGIIVVLPTVERLEYAPEAEVVSFRK